MGCPVVIRTFRYRTNLVPCGWFRYKPLKYQASASGFSSARFCRKRYRHVASRLLVVATGRAAKLVNEQGNKLGSETTRHFLRTSLAVVAVAQFKLTVLL